MRRRERLYCYISGSNKNKPRPGHTHTPPLLLFISIIASLSPLPSFFHNGSSWQEESQNSFAPLASSSCFASCPHSEQQFSTPLMPLDAWHVFLMGGRHKAGFMPAVILIGQGTYSDTHTDLFGQKCSSSSSSSSARRSMPAAAGLPSPSQDKQQADLLQRACLCFGASQPGLPTQMWVMKFIACC